VVLSSGGDNFAKFETPLKIDAYDGKKFTLGGVVLSKTIQPVDQIPTDVDATLLEDRTPMIVKGMQITPAANYSFKQSDRVVIYSQVYAPLLTTDATAARRRGLQHSRCFQQTSVLSGPIALEEYVQKGNAVVPFGLMVQVKDLPPGTTGWFCRLRMVPTIRRRRAKPSSPSPINLLSAEAKLPLLRSQPRYQTLRGSAQLIPTLLRHP